MGEQITSALAQTLQLTVSDTADVTDQSFPGTHTVTWAAGYYRTFLAPTTGVGTSDTDPKEFIAYVMSILGSRWKVSMTATGRISVTNLGNITGEIKWGTYVVRNALGFAADILLTAGASITAPNQPTHMILSCSRTNDTGWQDEPAGEAGAEFPDGVVDYLGDGYTLSRRTYTLARLPRTSVEATSLSSNVTPMWPIDSATTRRKQPTATVASTSTAVVYSVHEFLASALGKRIAVTHGDFQALVALSATTYDLCYLSPKTRAGKAVHSVAYWKARMDRPGVEVLWYDSGVTT